MKYETLQKQIRSLQERNRAITLELMSLCSEVVDRLDPAAAKATLAFRKELGLTVDKQWYQAQRTRAIERNAARGKTITSQLQNALKPKDDDVRASD
jgi:hypothetical protein